MSKIPQSSSRELCPSGTHQAVCVQVIEQGTQPSGDYDPCKKVQLAFELTDEKTSDGKAMVAYRNYSFKASPRSALMKDLKSWLGVDSNDFEMDDCLGKNALITIEHNESGNGTFANITNVGAIAKSMRPKKATEELKSLYLDETFDEGVFKSLPEFIQNKIASSPEYAELMESRMKKTKDRPAVKAAVKNSAPASKAKVRK